jgi:hypothetical protein
MIGLAITVSRCLTIKTKTPKWGIMAVFGTHAGSAGTWWYTLFQDQASRKTDLPARHAVRSPVLVHVYWSGVRSVFSAACA